MTKISKKTQLHARYKNSEHFNLNEQIVKYLKDKISPFTDLLPLYNSYAASFEQEDIEFKKYNRQPGTQVLETLEKKRNAIYSHIRRTNNFMQKSSHEEMQKASAAIGHVLHNYKDISRVSYVENSALITNMIEDLNLPENAAFAGELGLTELINDLKEANEEFKVEYDKRVLENSLTNLDNARRQTDMDFFKLADAINAKYLVVNLPNNPDAQLALLTEMIKDVNLFLLNAERIYARRVPSYTMAGGSGGNGSNDGDDGDKENPDENWETYMMTVDHDYWNTLPEQPYLFFFFYDADPDAFDKRFRGVDLSGANFYWGIETDNDETFFSHFLEEDGKLVGFAAYNNRLNVSGMVEGKDSVLRRNGIDLIRLDKAHAPEFID